METRLILSSRILDNRTVFLDENQSKVLFEKAPYLVSMATENLSDLSPEDFIEDYKEFPQTYYDLSLSKVIEYFRENGVKDLMEYGNDSDEGLYHLSSMNQEIMDTLGIKYSNVYTEDVSDGKYLTTIIFENDSSIEVDTSAWNGIKVVAGNMESIYETYENLKEKSKQNEVKNENEFEYDFN